MMVSEKDDSVKRIDALDKVTGKAKFPADFYYPDQLVMKVLFTEKVHAIVRSVDISEASRLPGVIAILTSTDVPNNEYGLGKTDQPVLCGPTPGKEYANRVRCLSDKIALVIAETDEIAEDAKRLIKVDYEELPIVDNVDLAFTASETVIQR